MKRLNEAGFTLMDTMIVSAVLLSMISTFALYQYQRNKEIKAEETRTSVNQVKESIKGSAVQAHSLGQSEELLFSNPNL